MGTIIDDFTTAIDPFYNKATVYAENLLGNPAITAIGGAIAGSAVTGALVSGISSSAPKRRSSAPKKRSKARSKPKSKSRSYKYARTAGKRRDTSTKRIRMTKNGQPYVILKSGKARFISKRSARLSRKRKGGRY